MSEYKKFWKSLKPAYRFLIVICSLVLVSAIFFFYNDQEIINGTEDSRGGYVDLDTGNPDLVENGLHVRTGLKDAPGLQETVNNCTTCHSAKLVIQNRMSAERWHATIRWMQETQNLWPLGDKEDIIVNYLVANYPPKDKGRREGLADIDWYELKR